MVRGVGRGAGRGIVGRGGEWAPSWPAQIGPIAAGFLVGLGLVLAAAIAYGRWRQGGIDWRLVWLQIRSLDHGWFGAAAGLAVGSYVVRAVRWGVMLRAVKKEARLLNILSATAIGFTAVLLLGRAGELVRPYMIARKEGVSLTSQLGAWLLERLYDLLAALLLLGYALVHWPEMGGRIVEGLRAAGWTMLAAAFCGLGAVVVMGFRPDWARRRVLASLVVLPRSAAEKVEKHVEGFLQGLATVRSLRDQCCVAWYTALEWVVVGAGCWCFFRASGLTAMFGVHDVLVFLGVVSLGSLLQVPGIGGGVQLAATIVLTELYGLPVEASMGLAVALWFITFVVVVPFGVGFGLHEGVNWITIKRVSEQVRG